MSRVNRAHDSEGDAEVMAALGGTVTYVYINLHRQVGDRSLINSVVKLMVVKCDPTLKKKNSIFFAFEAHSNSCYGYFSTKCVNDF